LTISTTTLDAPHTGLTRTAIRRDHALITPESHVPVRLPNWHNAEAVVVISQEMGAKFEQTLVNCLGKSRLEPLRTSDELFVLVRAGEITLGVGEDKQTIGSDSYAYIPPGGDWVIEAAHPAKLLVFSKPYIGIAGHQPPDLLVRALADVPAEPFLGDEGALLQVLLPDSDLSYDWGINLFDFVPGGTLPNVESHFMEHGLMLLGGQGVYRLGDYWYPVTEGDCLWMGPFVPQWYVAAGKTHSRYIYYKEMNRPPVG